MPNAVDTKPTSSCPDKTYSGTVNGQNVCVPYPTQTTGGTTNSTTTDTPASGVPASNSSSTSTSTTCDGATCTTTTTTTGSGTGGSGSGGAASGTAAGPCQATQVSTGGTVNGGAGTCTTTTSQPQEDYCKQNPTAAQCKKDSASGGVDCSAPPTCDGDAISCAILAQQWNTRCELQKHDDSTDLGAKLGSGQDPLAGKLPTPDGADKVDMSSKFSNVDDMGIAAQCLGNIDVPLQLPDRVWSLHMDTTPLCDIGKLLGYLNMLGTMMLCAYMLKGSF
ncbi:virulence factor TspB C-terminal domain-related protein [Ralstonia sp. UBA689]|uniref:virulence factor TspB C-terminal domain-related protein n=1 Tax=Ralstonia sp. UBA689 TaxID=1947373 RepID=UPI0025FF8550|nr:virulence factor TspB C-terminal domain-related protein [Ralstonia sp. UBA689]